MKIDRCIWCHGSGIYASPLTNWDGVPCDRCNGTGEPNPLVQIGDAVSRQLIAELDAYMNQHGELPVVAVSGR